jgi:hypothetical protein
LWPDQVHPSAEPGRCIPAHARRIDAARRARGGRPGAVVSLSLSSEPGHARAKMGKRPTPDSLSEPVMFPLVLLRRRRRKARRRGSASRAGKPSSGRHAPVSISGPGGCGPKEASRPNSGRQEPSSPLGSLGRVQGGPADFCCLDRLGRAHWATFSP